MSGLFQVWLSVSFWPPMFGLKIKRYAFLLYVVGAGFGVDLAVGFGVGVGVAVGGGGVGEATGIGEPVLFCVEILGEKRKKPTMVRSPRKRMGRIKDGVTLLSYVILN